MRNHKTDGTLFTGCRLFLCKKELEKLVREKGASCVELQAVNDDLHENDYGKAGYRDATNLVMKVKWFE